VFNHICLLHTVCRSPFPHTLTPALHYCLLQIINCLFTAAYSLYMRGAMDRVAQHTSDGKKLSEFSMVSGGQSLAHEQLPASRAPSCAETLCL